VVLSNATGYGSFMLLLLPLLVLLHVERRLPSGDLIAVVGLLIIFALLLIGLRLALSGPPLPTWLLRRLPIRIRSFMVRVRAHNLSLRDFFLPYALAIMVDLVGAFTLALSLAAIGQRPSLSAALLGTEIGTLFTVVSPLFQGLGVVELSLTVVLEQFGISSAAALSAALLYRACTLLIPFLVELLSLAWQAITWGVGRIQHHPVTKHSP
jgi:phosphatidylglycerol lysyltransferase